MADGKPKNQGAALEKISVLAQEWRKIQLSWYCFWDRRVRARHKLIPLAALAYVIMPIDFLPDVMPVLGQVDDIAVILFAMSAFLKCIPVGILQEHFERMTKKPNPAGPAGKGETVVDGTARHVDPKEPSSGQSRTIRIKPNPANHWSHRPGTEREE